MPCTPWLVETWRDLTKEALKKAVTSTGVHECVKLSSVFATTTKAARWVWSPQAYVQKTNEVTRNAALVREKQAAIDPVALNGVQLPTTLFTFFQSSEN